MTTAYDLYLVFCFRVNEEFGLQLGLIDDDQFLEFLQDATNNWCRDTGCSKVFVTQTVNFGIPLYSTPDLLLDIEALFVQGRFKPRTNLESLDNSRFRWRTLIGAVDVWHQDGLPINTVSLVPKPNWTGAQYPVQPNGDPGWQYIDGSQSGAFAGTATSNNSNLLVLVSGGPFYSTDTTWFGKTIIFNGTPYIITSVIDGQHLLVNGNIPAAVGAAWSVNYPIAIPVSDRNLTTYGRRMPDPQTYTLDTTIPFLPDSACLYLGYGILYRVFNSDTELKDRQKALYCKARWTEGVNLFRAIMEEELLDRDSE